MAKLFGYIIGFVGVAGIVVYSIPELFTATEKFLQTLVGNPAFKLSATGLMIISIGLFLCGLFVASRGARGKRYHGGKEVPIYKGGAIVGYRQH